MKQRRRIWKDWTTTERVVTGVLAAPVAVLLAVGIVTSSKQDDEPSQMFTGPEAACEMLEAGDSPEQAYRALVDIAEDHQYAVGSTSAARAAIARGWVDSALADGC